MLKKLPLATAIALAFAGSAGAHAAEFEVGDFRVKFDSIISYGAAWRMEDRDMRLIHPGNMDGGMGQSGVADDGNLNYDQGDLVSSVVKGVHDLSIDGGDYGAFVRFKYWYDDVIKNNEVPHGHTATNYFPDVTLNNDGLDDYSTGSGFELLDAFVYAYFDLGDMPANLRVGRQVLSWGESTFIFNGVNSINPIDVNAVRRPGVEIKEALLPVGMVNLNLGLTDATSLDMFYQYEWDNTKLDGCGTFFSTVDILGGPGCNKVTLNPTLVPGQPSSSLSDRESVEFGTYLDRSPNIEPDDGGQYGFALRHYNMDLDVEFGVYYMNIHNQTPIISAYNWVEQPSPGLSHPDGLPIAGPNYVLQYPEDQEIMGASFSTNFGLWSVGGEYSFRPDLAVQINTTEILTAGLRAGVPSTFSNRIRRDETGAITNLGELQPGYDELDVSQFQLTGIRFLDNVLGASRLTFIGEVAMNKVHSLPSLDEQRYGRNPVYGKCLTQADQQMLGNPSPAADINCEGFVTASSWGYRTRFVAEYNNVVAGWNLTPTLAFGHDVKGYSPNSNFIEGRKTIGLSVDASYLSSYKIGVGYNINTGGDYEPASDRDFASVSFSYSF
ncbi:DUF1302 domain-containing protein [Pseudidiomarina sp. 1APP75-32.1]|uniref:DUF1302 domain-containing protein n=2 Tax=Pseudidiomarina terrestris TaxID=2820060 RepID=A0AAW7QY98_9GAMM|nr:MULTISPECIES: DUF1302 domain-containing protein [unclassified Pseudidiomarina]MDN7124416.1 DUF1302 domain-containing protein [Pseudidiomarina sp. 1APP75-32.1]MDN7129293.1 DUF1302 domain-containing protein [Pseudidiomarina sp. 1APR75-15]MEA3587764.1 DUF1302 domain-containing protein [Pseudidiomarina sp. 1APP75-27a]